MYCNLKKEMNSMASTTTKKQKNPFKPSLAPFWGPANQARLKRAITDLNAGKGQHHKLIEVNDGK